MTVKLIITIWVLLISSVLGVGCAQEREPSVTPAEFYKDKTIELVVAGSPASDEEVLARHIASYLGRDTGAVVTVTTRSGASGLEAVNQIYKAEPGGLTLGMAASAKFVPNRILKEPAAQYELEQFSYIMSIGSDLHYFFVSADGYYQSVADLQTGKNLKIGGSSASGSVSLGGLIVIKLLDLDAKVITGLTGTSNRVLATIRGEIVGFCQDLASMRESMAAGMLKPMFVLATQRDPQMKEVPAITETAILTDKDIALVKFWETAFANSDILFAPPGIPEDRREYLCGLAEKWIQDKDFRAGINAIDGVEVIKYATGNEVTNTMLDLAPKADDFQTIFIELIDKYRD